MNGTDRGEKRREWSRWLLTESDIPRWVIWVLIASGVIGGIAGKRLVEEPLQRQVAELQARQVVLGELIADEPMDYDGLPYEPEHDHAAKQVVAARLPNDRITWWVDPEGVAAIRPSVTVAQVREVMRASWAEWAKCLNIEPVEVMDERSAMVRHRYSYIDGRGRTLAWSYLPDGSDRPIEQRYDTGETWSLGGPAPSQIALGAVAVHEIGHALGLTHDQPGVNAIMTPTYSADILTPRERDCQRAVNLGYKRRTEPPTPPVPGDTLSVPAQLRTADVVDALEKLGYKVAAPVP